MLARGWLELQKGALSQKTFHNKQERSEAFVFPYIGKRPIAHLKAGAILPLLKKVDARGRNEITHRVRSECGNVFRYAAVTGRTERDPTVDLQAHWPRWFDAIARLHP